MHILSIHTLLLALVFGACSSSTTQSSSEQSASLSRTTTVVTEEPPQKATMALAADADPREVRLAKTIAVLLKSKHVRKQEIDDNLSQKSFQTFLKGIDASKLFLLEEDIELFRSSSNFLDDQILTGNLQLAHQATDRLAMRQEQVKSIVIKHLATPLDFQAQEWRETDPEKIAYAQTIDELSDRWRKLLKHGVLDQVNRMAIRSEEIQKTLKKGRKGRKKARGNDSKSEQEYESLRRILAKIPKTLPERVAKAQEDLTTNYSAQFNRLADQDSLNPATIFLNAIASSFDPHTSYLPPIEKENFDISMSGTVEGIGAHLREKDHYIQVLDIIPGGASWRQGELESGDLIISVTNKGKEPVDISDMNINKVVQMIRGPKGTVVTLTVEKEDGSIKSIAIDRDRVSREASYAQGAIVRSPSGAKMGYIDLPSFYGDTRGHDPNARSSANDVKKLLSIFSTEKLPGVVIDVRGNGGGLLDDSRRMAGFFIEKGPIVQTLMPDGTLEVLSDSDPSVVYSGQVVVLVNKFSASASEILAAALQDYGRALVVGTGPTHGKGTVQALMDLDRFNMGTDNLPMGVLKMTVQQFFRVSGGSTQKKGVTPDIGFPDSFKFAKSSERYLDNALPWRSVDKQAFTAWPTSWDQNEVVANSETRQTKSEYFTSVKQLGELNKKRNDDTRIPLKQSEFDARIKSQTDEVKALLPTSSQAPKNLFGATPVKYAQTPEVVPRKKGGKGKVQIWLEKLTKDPEIEESLSILGDMMK